MDIKTFKIGHRVTIPPHGGCQNKTSLPIDAEIVAPPYGPKKTKLFNKLCPDLYWVRLSFKEDCPEFKKVRQEIEYSYPSAALWENHKEWWIAEHYTRYGKDIKNNIGSKDNLMLIKVSQSDLERWGLKDASV